MNILNKPLTGVLLAIALMVAANSSQAAGMVRGTLVVLINITGGEGAIISEQHQDQE